MQGLLLLCRGGRRLPLWGPGVDPFTSDTHQPQGVLPTQPSEMLPHDHSPPPTHEGAPGPACWGHGRNSTPMVVGPCGVTQDPVVLGGPGGGVLQTHTRNFPMCPGTARILGAPPSAGAGGAARAPLTGGQQKLQAHTVVSRVPVRSFSEENSRWGVCEEKKSRVTRWLQVTVSDTLLGSHRCVPTRGLPGAFGEAGSSPGASQRPLGR